MKRRLLTLAAALSVACAGAPPARCVRPAPLIPLREGDVYLCNAPGAPAVRVRAPAPPSVHVETAAGDVEASCRLLALP